MTDDTAGRLAAARKGVIDAVTGYGFAGWLASDTQQAATRAALDVYEAEARRQGRIEALREAGCENPQPGHTERCLSGCEEGSLIGCIEVDCGDCVRDRLLAEAEGQEGILP